MVWLAILLHWRDALRGWRRGKPNPHATLFERNLRRVSCEERARLRRYTRAAGRPVLTPNEMRTQLNLPPRQPDWVTRPLEPPEWTEAEMERFYRTWKRRRG